MRRRPLHCFESDPILAPGLRDGLLSRRAALRAGIAGGAVLMLPGFGGASARADAAVLGGVTPNVDSWKRYPYDLYPKNGLVFPAAEAFSPNQTDSWYIDSKLVTPSGKAYAFHVIFLKTRLGSVRADFYSFALYDLETGDYGTFTEYDYPDTSLRGAPKFVGATDHLDLRFKTQAGTATWASRKDSAGNLIPFAYRLRLVGRDRLGRAMRVEADMDPLNPPDSVGGPAAQGSIDCFGAKDTYTYFQTAPNITGTVTWGATSTAVRGDRGHIDRQIFTKYVGGKAGIFGRDRSHEWRSINLDDGTDISAWRQFDRTRRNALTTFTGASRVVPGRPTEDASTVEVEYIDYVKWPTAIPTAYSPVSRDRWSPSEHILRIPEWDLELHGRPLVPVPAHRMPVEYMIGPVEYTGTLRGRPVSGFGISERTLSLWRDWELAKVFQDTVLHLGPDVFTSGGVVAGALTQMARTVVQFTAKGIFFRGDLAQYLSNTVDPAVATLTDPRRSLLTQVLSDLRRAPLG